MLGLGDGDRQASPLWLPSEREEGAALALDRDRLRDQLGVYVLSEVSNDAARSALDQAGVPASLPIALHLRAQPRLVKGAAWRHRENCTRAARRVFGIDRHVLELRLVP